MGDTEDDLYRIAEKIASDEYRATLAPRPGDPLEEDEAAMREMVEGHSYIIL